MAEEISKKSTNVIAPDVDMSDHDYCFKAMEKACEIRRSKMNKPTFPFSPNEKVKAAFRSQAQRDHAVAIMTQALLEVAQQSIDPWVIAFQEHPELIEYRSQLKYVHAGCEMFEFREETK